jgi:dienelactone hydrolase
MGNFREVEMVPLNRFPTMMQDHFMARVRQTESQTEALKFGLKSKKAVLAYQDQVRRKIRSIIGPRPRRVPFNERITGGFEREHYRVENLLFDTRPNFPVTANLYIPRHRPLPAPCVLGVCGHSTDGKTAVNYQAFCQGLATKGYLVLIIDPVGQGERLQYPDEKGRTRYLGPVGEHIQSANHLSLLGEWLGSWRIWDGVRALDYLLSRPEADSRYVGLTGNSGGGTMSTWLMAADERFTMAAPGCYVTTWRRNTENEVPADSEQNPPGALAAGLDEDSFLFLHAPKPLIMLTQQLDFFDQRGSQQVFQRLQHLYSVLGHPENIKMFTGPGPHGYALELREAMYGFFNRQCGKQREGSKEPDCQPEAESALWATATGQVAGLGADTIPAHTRRQARQLAQTRPPLSQTALPQAVGRLLGVSAPSARSKKAAAVPEYRILGYTLPDRQYPRVPTYYSVESEPGIQVILTMLDSREYKSPLPEGKQALLYVPHLSSDEDLRTEPWVRELVSKHERSFAADLRGLGESIPNACGPDNYLTLYGSDFFFTSLSQMYGESLLGRRVFDLLRVVDLLAAHGYRQLEVAARGFGGLPALFAAILDRRITHLSLQEVPLSYEEIAVDEDYQWPLSAMVWGILKKLDLPDCYRALGRRLSISNPWDSRMQPIPPRQAAQRLRELGLSTGKRKKTSAK